MFGSLLNSIRSKASSQNCNRTRLWVSVHHILAMAPFAFVCVVVFTSFWADVAIDIISTIIAQQTTGPERFLALPNMEQHPENNQATNVWIRSSTRQSPMDNWTWTFESMDGTHSCDDNVFVFTLWNGWHCPIR